MKAVLTENLLSEIEELKIRLAEAEQLIEAIKAGEVDAFAFTKNNKPEIFTLESGDYAYRILVENFSEGALNLSEDGLIVYTNSYFHELLNLSYEKVISTSIFDFIHPSSKETFKRLFKKGLAGQSKGEIILSVAEKSIPVYVSLTSLYPTLPTVGMIVSDLSEKKKQEIVLEQKNAQLEKMNYELQAFAYISSHDLQEPLRKIQTFASRILEKENQNLSAYGKDHFKRMQTAASRMQKLIDDLLAYSRTNTAERVFEKTNLNTIIEDVKDDLKEEIQEKGATIESNELGDLNVIPFQFHQLIYNIITNALKYSGNVRSPRIKITGEILNGIQLNNDKLSPLDKYCHISISDNGIGFEQQYSEKIFEVFQRLHGKTEYTGTGIGLAIAKKIVENHNGIITAIGEPDKGAIFEIYIPAT